MPPFEFWVLIHSTKFSAIGGKFLEQIFTYICMRHLPASETNGDFEPVTVFEEFQPAFQFNVEII